MKKLSVAILFLTLSTIVFAGGNTEKRDAQQSVVKSEKHFKLKFSSASAPAASHSKAVEIFKETIEASTNQQIEVEFFPSGTLFKQDAEVSAMMRNALEMNYTSASWLADKEPSLSMLSAGYFFRDYQHMTKTLNGEIGKKLFDVVAKKLNIRPLGAFYLGSRTLNYREVGRQIKTPNDLKGVKLRMPNSPSWLFLGNALGANATTMNMSEVYLALKTGAVDAQDNPLSNTKVRKFYEVTKYITLTHHLVDSVWPTINENVWKEMGSDLQNKMYEAIEKARDFNDKNILKDESELVAFFKEQGITIVEPDKKSFVDAVQKAYLDNKEISGKWDMELFKKIQVIGN